MIVTLLYFAAGIIALVVVLVLFLPLSYSIRAEYKEVLSYSVSLGSPLFRFRSKRYGEATKTHLLILGLPIEKKQRLDRIEKEKKPKTKKKRQSMPWALLTRENLRHIFKLVADLLAMIRPRYLMFNARVGLAEPDLNGWLLAAYYSLQSLYAEFPLRWESVWDEECVEVEGAVDGSFIPAVLLWRLVVFIASRKTIRILWAMRRKKVAATAT